jgi:hypothetical protein
MIAGNSFVVVVRGKKVGFPAFMTMTIKPWSALTFQGGKPIGCLCGSMSVWGQTIENN